MAKFYYYTGQDNSGQNWRGVYHHSAKAAKEEAKAHNVGVAADITIMEVKGTDMAETMKNLLNQEQKIIGTVRALVTY